MIGVLVYIGLIFLAGIGATEEPSEEILAVPDSAEITAAMDTVAQEKDDRQPVGEDFDLTKKRPFAKTLGDLLWFEGGIFPLQHGPEGQPEILVKSILLGGQGVVVDGLPFYQQGLFVPERSGPDLNVVMFENPGKVELTRLNHLDLTTQGTVLSVRSQVRPPQNNPSSITVARGPYGYERTAWRFSRNFSSRLAGTFCVGFKKSRSYYTSGADYDGFGVSGSLAGSFRNVGEFQYGFYENKSEQGILQFDRIVPPSFRAKSDIIRHRLHYEHNRGAKVTMFSDLLYQKNEVKAGGLYISPKAWPADKTKMAALGVDFIGGRNKLRLAFAYKELRQYGQGAYTKALKQYSIFACDSLRVTSADRLELAVRLRNSDPGRTAGAVDIGYERNEEDVGFGIHGGYHDSDYDPYAVYFGTPTFSVNYSGLVEIDEYRIVTVTSAPAKSTLYALLFGRWNPFAFLKSDFSVSYEKVTGDSYWRLTDSSGIWSARPTAIDYDRAVITLTFETGLGEYLHSRAGMTSFLYSPKTTEWGERHSPAFIGFAESEVIWKGALRDVDLSAQAQARYCGRRCYYGFVDVEYGPFAVLDCAAGIRYGSFDFHVIGSNVFDFIIGNDYKLWGEYSMPPGTVWWVFNWKFSN